MEKLLYIEINAFCIVIALIVFIKILRQEKIKDRKILNLIWIIMILFFLSDVLWKIVEGTENVKLCNFFNSIYFSMAGVFAYLWYLYCETTLETKFHKKLIFKILIPLPAVFLFVISFIDGLVFSTGNNGEYFRGPLYFVQPLVSFGYMIATSLRSILYGLNKDYLVQIKTKNLAKFSFYPIICGSLQVIFFGTPLVSIGITLSVISIFIDIQRQKITKDPLTQLNNRIDLLKYLEWQINRFKNRNSNNSLYVLYLDINDFKHINDNFGHSEGDNALCLIAKTLQSISEENGVYVSRIGGDEFVIVSELESDEKLNEFITYVKEKISDIGNEKYKLSASIGSSKYDGTDIETIKILEDADKRLYEEKKYINGIS